jgi:hypothetical protein
MHPIDSKHHRSSGRSHSLDQSFFFIPFAHALFRLNFFFRGVSDEAVCLEVVL